MTAVLAALLTAAIVVVAGGGGRRPLRRHGTSDVAVSRRRLPSVLVPAALGVAWLGYPAVVGTAAVVGIAVVARVVRRARPTARSELALVLDVLAGCLAAGAAMPSALTAARAVSTDQVSNAFAAAALALDGGEDPDATWTRVAAAVPELAPVSRLCARAAMTGAPVATELHRMAASHRAALNTWRRQRLQRASVWLVLPLGLCFLPAFVLVGVVPLVIGALPGSP